MRKGVVLLVVMIVLIVLSAFAVLALYFMSNEARVTEHKVGRMKAFYTAQAAMLVAQKRLADGDDAQIVEGEINDGFKMNNLNVIISILESGEEGCSAPVGQYCIETKVDY